MLNHFKRSTTRQSKHEDEGCGCASHHAHAPATDDTAQTQEGCCSGRGAKAVNERSPSIESDDEHGSHHSHDSCCGGHSATVPAGQPAVRERGR